MSGELGDESWKIHQLTPQKSNIDTNNCHFQRELPFPRPIILGIHVRFRDVSAVFVEKKTLHHSPPNQKPNGNPEAEPPRESHPRNFKPPGDHFLPFRSTSVPDEKLGS